MGLLNVFANGVETAFKTFNEAVKEGAYTVIFDDGWGGKTESSTNVRIICDTFKQEDIHTLIYGNLIQPTDIKGLIPGVDLTDIVVSTKDTVKVADVVYAVEGFDVDPYNVLYTFLLRKT